MRVALDLSGQAVINLQTLDAASLGMKLAGKNIPSANARTESNLPVIRCRQNYILIIRLGNIRMDEVHKIAVSDFCQRRTLPGPTVAILGGNLVDIIPANLRHLEFSQSLGWIIEADRLWRLHLANPRKRPVG